MSQLGLLLRDAALLRSREGREEAIRLVREFLWGPDAQVAVLLGKPLALTADDVQHAVDVLFGEEMKERRWTANVLVGWDRVRVTDRVVRSRRPVNHGRRVAVWEWVA